LAPGIAHKEAAAGPTAHALPCKSIGVYITERLMRISIFDQTSKLEGDQKLA
jgi:hypothetical protein